MQKGLRRGTEGSPGSGARETVGTPLRQRNGCPDGHGGGGGRRREMGHTAPQQAG